MPSRTRDGPPSPPLTPLPLCVVRSAAEGGTKTWAIQIYFIAAMLLYISFYKYYLPPTKGRLNNVLLYMLFFGGLMLAYLLQPRTHPFRLAAPPLD